MKKNIINIIRHITLFILICTNINCGKNLIADIPAYIEIQEFNYINNSENTKPYTSNYHSTKITDAWVTMDGQFLGVFEIPCIIPIHLANNLQSSLHSFDIYPGIKVNGISATRAQYPFYEKFAIDTAIFRDSTVLLKPTTQYKDIAVDKFDGLGTFELKSEMILNTDSTMQISDCTNLSSSSATPIIQADEVFQGESSLAIYLNNEQNYFHISSDTINLEGTTFLELNFKTTTTLKAGLIIVNSGKLQQKEELIQLHPTNIWKKTYLDITHLINKGNSYSSFKIYFEGCGLNNSTNHIYIDNLKLMSRS
tara:strand:- start:312 stop:1241 length:930 start_codon:yes stop_codon:yes gene_type:complete